MKRDGPFSALRMRLRGQTRLQITRGGPARGGETGPARFIFSQPPPEASSQDVFPHGWRGFVEMGGGRGKKSLEDLRVGGSRVRRPGLRWRVITRGRFAGGAVPRRLDWSKVHCRGTPGQRHHPRRTRGAERRLGRRAGLPHPNCGARIRGSSPAAIPGGTSTGGRFLIEELAGHPGIEGFAQAGPERFHTQGHTPGLPRRSGDGSEPCGADRFSTNTFGGRHSRGACGPHRQVDQRKVGAENRQTVPGRRPYRARTLGAGGAQASEKLVDRAERREVGRR